MDHLVLAGVLDQNLTPLISHVTLGGHLLKDPLTLLALGVQVSWHLQAGLSQPIPRLLEGNSLVG